MTNQWKMVMDKAMPQRPGIFRTALRAVISRLTSPKARKTYSWGVVSFAVIWPLEVGGHWCMYGADGIGHAIRAAALGTAVACVGKAPVYWLHEHVWDWLLSRPRHQAARRPGEHYAASPAD